MKAGFIDWTDKGLGIYVFEIKGRQYTLLNTSCVTTDRELSSSAIMQLVKNNSYFIAGIEHIYLSVPVTLLTLRELSLPFADEDKIKDTIPFELEGLLLGEASDYCTDHLLIESAKSGSKILAASIEKARLRNIIDTFLSAGLEPEVITSVDLRLSNGNVEKLLECLVPDKEDRAAAAREELTNPTINLRQEELSYKGDVERLRKSVRITALLALILLILLCSDMATRLLSLKKENVMLAREINTIYRDAFPEDKKIIDAMRQFNGNLKALRGEKIILTGMPLLDILLNVSQLKNQNITIYGFNADGRNIFLKGTAATFEDVDSFKKSLSSSFMDVKVMDSKAAPDKKINFAVSMRAYDL